MACTADMGRQRNVQPQADVAPGPEPRAAKMVSHWLFGVSADLHPPVPGSCTAVCELRWHPQDLDMSCATAVASCKKQEIPKQHRLDATDFSSTTAAGGSTMQETTMRQRLNAADFCSTMAVVGFKAQQSPQHRLDAADFCSAMAVAGFKMQQSPQHCLDAADFCSGMSVAGFKVQETSMRQRLDRADFCSTMAVVGFEVQQTPPHRSDAADFCSAMTSAGLKVHETSPRHHLSAAKFCSTMATAGLAVQGTSPQHGLDMADVCSLKVQEAPLQHRVDAADFCSTMAVAGFEVQQIPPQRRLDVARFGGAMVEVGLRMQQEQPAGGPNLLTTDLPVRVQKTRACKQTRPDLLGTAAPFSTADTLRRFRLFKAEAADRRRQRDRQPQAEGSWGQGQHTTKRYFCGLLPFKADFYLPVLDLHIAVCQHLSRPRGFPVRSIALFFPGVFGGVGPGRAPGRDYDDAAIFPTVARRLTQEWKMPLDCYRVSWPETAPSMAFVVACTRSVLNMACQKSLGEACPRNGQEMSLYLIGHSLGGAAALEAALSAVGPHRHVAGRAVRLAGLCTLSTILYPAQLPLSAKRLHILSEIRSLLVVGDADTHPEITAFVHRMLPSQDKKLQVLPAGTHDLFAHRDILVDEISRFIGKEFMD